GPLNLEIKGFRVHPLHTFNGRPVRGLLDNRCFVNLSNVLVFYVCNHDKICVLLAPDMSAPFGQSGKLSQNIHHSYRRLSAGCYKSPPAVSRSTFVKSSECGQKLSVTGHRGI